MNVVLNVIQSKKTKLIKSLSGLAAAFFVVGCASTEPTTANAGPTHYWDADVPAETYTRDNVTCQRATDSSSTEAFETDSMSFQAYRDCMITKGYTLRNY